MNGGYFGWTNLMEQSKCTNKDFSIIKHSRNYSCKKMKKRIPGILHTKVDTIVYRMMLSSSNGLENNLWLYLSRNPQQKQSFSIKENLYVG